jgi:hypothetical protein
MADAIRSFFSFSSPYHLVWFCISMTWLAVALTFPRTVWPRAYGCVGHAVTTIDAILHVLTAGNGPVYSVHCIWFNALMAFAHWQLLKRAATRIPPD